MKSKLVFALATTLYLVGGCKAENLELKNENQYSDGSYFTNASTFNEGIVSTYSCLLQKGMYARDFYFLFDLMGNEAERDAPLLGDLLQLHNFTFGSSHQQITDLWQTMYRQIFRANLMIDKLNAWKPTLPEEQAIKKAFLGEVAFLRGYAYFNLVNLWGRVPIRADYGSSKDFFVGRASTADVWKIVEADLLAAQTSLPLMQSADNLGRATSGAATAMLGKAFLYQKKYAQAATELAKLTQAPYAYKLSSDFDDQFSDKNSGSSETVFDIPHKWNGWGLGNAYYMFGGQEAWGGKATHTGRAMEYGWNDWRNVFISDAAVKSFIYADEAGKTYSDPRAKLTFYGNAASGGDTDYCNKCASGSKPYPYNASNGFRWRKYNNYEFRENEEQPQSEINTQVIRFADVLLMLAEAQIEQGNNAAALPLINRVRSRVKAFNYTALGSQENARTIIRRERRLELCGEQSRYFDLLRWGTIQQTINAEKQLQIGSQPFQTKNVFLPIPQIEKDVNPTVARDVTNNWN